MNAAKILIRSVLCKHVFFLSVTNRFEFWQHSRNLSARVESERHTLNLSCLMLCNLSTEVSTAPPAVEKTADKSQLIIVFH